MLSEAAHATRSRSSEQRSPASHVTCERIRISSAHLELGTQLVHEVLQPLVLRVVQREPRDQLLYCRNALACARWEGRGRCRLLAPPDLRVSTLSSKKCVSAEGSCLRQIRVVSYQIGSCQLDMQLLI